jgi:hypothetical protein
VNSHKGLQDEIAAVERPQCNGARLEKDLATLADLSREELVKRWVKAFGTPPPKGVKRALIERAFAWQIQAKRFGGLSAEAKKTLKRFCNGETRGPDAQRDNVDAGRRSDDAISAATARPAEPGRGRSAVNPLISMRPKPRPGTRLLREWNGRTYVVDVTEAGFAFDGKTYRSLSAIARRITGAQWSGPRFFGL